METDKVAAPQIADRPFTPAKAPTAGSNKLGKDEFVKLLLAQLQHQDPTSPMDGEAFVAQLAQFANLEQMNTANSNLESLIMGQAAAHQTSVVSLVGKDVLYRSDGVTLAQGQPARSLTNLPQAAGSVTAVVTDSNGRTVRTMQLGARAAGPLEITWDGKDDAGEALPPGDYHIRIAAADKEGKNIPVEARARARVDGVSFEEGVPAVLVGGGKIKLSDIVEITERNTP
jgi:flagellar basal-body rod modification protein FlgD